MFQKKKMYFLKKIKGLNLQLYQDHILFINVKNDIKYRLLFENYLFGMKIDKQEFLFNKLINSYKFKRLVKKVFRNVTVGYFLILEVFGLGFTIAINKTKTILRFNIGFNHSIFYIIPKHIRIKTKKKSIYLFSYSFFLLKNIVTEIKNFRKLSIYKLKGIKEKNLLYVKKD